MRRSILREMIGAHPNSETKIYTFHCTSSGTIVLPTIMSGRQESDRTTKHNDFGTRLLRINMAKGKKTGGRIKKENAIVTLMNLPESTRELARAIGGGNMTAGVERLFAILPIFNQCKLILELIAEKPENTIELRDQIESVLLELETLEIERVYEECITEGVIKTKGGAYIV